VELAILVYVIDLLLKVVTFSKGFLGLMVFVTFCWALFGLLISYSYSSEDTKRHFKKYYPYKLMILAGFLIFLIPNPQTMKYIGSAYLVQTTFESDFVQETASLSQKAIIKQLKVWAADSPDIKPLLNEIGVENVELVKEKALQEVDKVLSSTQQTKQEK